MERNIVFKIKNNFVEYITFNILNEYQDIGRDVSFNKTARTAELIKQGVPM